MTTHETKAQECAERIWLADCKTVPAIKSHILRHFPEPQSEYTWPELCETPRTDAAEIGYRDSQRVPADFARQLERELNELRKDKERLSWLDFEGFNNTDERYWNKMWAIKLPENQTGNTRCIRTAIDKARNK
jgi:hypothetical protein